MARLAALQHLLLCFLAFSTLSSADVSYPQPGDLIALEPRAPLAGELVHLEPRTPIRNYINVAQGLLRSKSIGQLLGKIPCSVVSTLQTNANEAKSFVTDLEAKKVPKLIANLPADVTNAFKGVIGILGALPSTVIQSAEAAAANITNIVDKISQGKANEVPGIIASDVSKQWSSITAGFTDAFKGLGCLIANNCPSTQSCLQGSTAIPNATPRPTNVGPTTLIRVPTTPVIVPSVPATIPRPTSIAPAPTTRVLTTSVTQTQLVQTTVRATQIVQSPLVVVPSVAQVNSIPSVSSASPVSGQSTTPVAAFNGASVPGIYSDWSVYGVCMLAAFGVTGVAFAL